MIEQSHFIRDCMELITDAWDAYNPLNELGFHHWSLSHRHTFVDPYTGFHTNTIEGLWGFVN